jgi:hypothetical protein
LKTGALECLQLLRGRHQQRGGFVGSNNPRGVRVECHDNRRGATFFGDPADAIQNLAMAAMHAIEIPERQDRSRPTRRPRIVRKVNDVHAHKL